MSLDEFKNFLPKYLSEKSTEKLLESLRQFPENIDEKIYTNHLQNESVIFQGDGLFDLPYYNFESDESKNVNGIVLSNTCDVDLSNKRLLDIQLSHSPLVKLRKFKQIILKNTSKTKEQVDNYIEHIKRQKVTNIFYLPKKHKDSEEYIVMFDRVMSIPNKTIDRNKLDKKRMFTLSDYGIYLFIFKLSVHFNRFQDKVERKSLI
ncbi:MAG: hypothetical protein ACTJF0_08835 [Psychroflexus halocasei]